MSRQHFLIRGKHLGTVERERIWVHSEKAEAYGYAFFCPLCAETWALCPVEGQPTLPHISPCDKHRQGDKLGDWNHGSIAPYQVPGSLMLSYEQTWNDALPLAVLVREFHLHYNLHKEQHV